LNFLRPDRSNCLEAQWLSNVKLSDHFSSFAMSNSYGEPTMLDLVTTLTSDLKYIEL